MFNEYLDAVRRWLDELEAIPLSEVRPSGLSSQEKLCRNLGELSHKARILRHHVRSRIANNGPRAHYDDDVEPLDLLNADYLSTEDRLELQWSNTSGVYEGKLESYIPLGENKQFDFICSHHCKFIFRTSPRHDIEADFAHLS